MSNVCSSAALLRSPWWRNGATCSLGGSSLTTTHRSILATCTLRTRDRSHTSTLLVSDILPRHLRGAPPRSTAPKRAALSWCCVRSASRLSRPQHRGTRRRTVSSCAHFPPVAPHCQCLLGVDAGSSEVQGMSKPSRLKRRVGGDQAQARMAASNLGPISSASMLPSLPSPTNL